MTIEAALNPELDDHLESTDTPKKNSRNGHMRKRSKTEDGELELATSRDRGELNLACPHLLATQFGLL